MNCCWPHPDDLVCYQDAMLGMPEIFIKQRLRACEQYKQLWSQMTEKKCWCQGTLVSRQESTCVQNIVPARDLGQGACVYDVRDVSDKKVFCGEHAPKNVQHALLEICWQRCRVVSIPSRVIMHSPIDLSVILADGSDGLREKIIIDVGAHARVTFRESKLVGVFMRVCIKQGAQVTWMTDASKKMHEPVLRYEHYDCYARAIFKGVSLRQAHGARWQQYCLNADARVTVRDVYVSTLSQSQSVAITHEHKGARSNADTHVLSIVAPGAQMRCASDSMVARGVKNVQSMVQHKAMLMGDGARVVVRPSLTINQGEVVCTHGAAVGGFDEEHLWYLSSRGLAHNAARMMLLRGAVHSLLTEDIADASIDDCLGNY